MARTAVDLFEAYQELAGEAKDLVDVLAVAYSPLPMVALEAALRQLGARETAKALIPALRSAGLVEVGRTFQHPLCGPTYADAEAAVCAGSVAEPVTRELVKQGRFAAIAAAVRAVSRSPSVRQAPFDATRPDQGIFNFESRAHMVRFVRLAFYEGDHATIARVFAGLAHGRTRQGMRLANFWLRYDQMAQQMDAATIYVAICFAPFDRQWFLELPPDVVDTTLVRMAQATLRAWGELPAGAFGVLVDGCQGRLGRRVPVDWHAELARWRWLQGEFDACREQLACVGGTGLSGCLALLRGDPGAAIAGFEAELASSSRKLGKGPGKVVFAGPVGALHLIALWLRDEPDDAARAGALLKLWLKATPEGLLREAMALVPDLRLNDPGAQGRFDQLLGSLEPSRLSDPLGFTIAYLIAAWLHREAALDNADAAEAVARLAHDRGLAWPAAELDAIAGRLGVADPEAARAAAGFEAERQVALLANQLPLVEPWELVLQSLVAIGTPSSQASPAAPRESRLAWVVSERPVYGSLATSYALEAREQKRTTRGWSKGIKVAPGKLAKMSAEGKDWLSEQDHRAARHVSIDRQRYQEVFGPGAWLELVGHPHVFRDDSQEPIEVVAGQLELHVMSRGKDGVWLDLHPEFEPGAEVAVWEESPSRLKVAAVSPEHRRIRKALGDDGLVVPEAGRAKVLEALGAVSALVMVHSDIGGVSRTSHAVPADDGPRVQLVPDGGGLRVEVVVRPFGEAGPYVAPGQGARALFIDHDGERLHTERDLAREHERAEALIASCPTLASTEPEGTCSWRIGDLERCLALLEELQSAPSVAVEWPSGQSLTLAGRADSRQLGLRVKASGADWFGLDGELAVSEDLVLDMGALLELVRRGRGRFLQLDDGRFVALTEALRRRLADLAALSDAHGKSRRVHALAAPLVAELEGEVGSFKAAKEWRAGLARIREAEALRPAVPDGLQAELRDYQVEGFGWLARLAHWGAGACLADDMGLGKTLQALAILLRRGPEGPALVIAPTSVCSNWQSEARRFAPALEVHQLGSQDREAAIEALGPRDVLVCSYGLLQQPAVAELLAARTWRTIVLDEAQAIKNVATRRSQAAMSLQGDFRLVTTGTPVENHLGELWNLFRFLNSGLLGSQERFNRQFAGPIERGDKEARARLKRLVQPFILRRLKSQVLDELPPRTEIQLDVELSDQERAFYEALRRKLLRDLDQSGPARDGPRHLQVLAALMKLRRACCHSTLAAPDVELPSSKLAVFGELVEELVDNHHKALVFSQFVDHLAKIRQELEARGISYQYLDGQTPAAERKRRVDAFQSGEGAVFLISLKAGGVGLNLTAADYVIHMDPWWNPAVEDQASDRAHRIGQSRPVTVYRLVSRGTIEEKIVALHRHKRDLADSILSGTDGAARIDADELLKLLKEA